MHISIGVLGATKGVQHLAKLIILEIIPPYNEFLNPEILKFMAFLKFTKTIPIFVNPVGNNNFTGSQCTGCHGDDTRYKTLLKCKYRTITDAMR